MQGPGKSLHFPFSIFLSWLEPHIKHREMSSNFSKASPGSLYTEKGSSEPLSVESTPTPEASEPSTSSTPERFILSSTPSTSSQLHSLPATPTHSASMMALSPLSCMVQKKRRQREQDDCFNRQMAQLEERRLELQKKLADTHEYSCFGQTVADMLRRLPANERSEVIWKVYNTLNEHRQQD